MKQQEPAVVYDLRGDRLEVAFFCEPGEIEHLAFTPDGLPTYTGHDGTGKLVKFLVNPRPAGVRPGGFRWMF